MLLLLLFLRLLLEDGVLLVHLTLELDHLSSQIVTLRLHLEDFLVKFALVLYGLLLMVTQVFIDQPLLLEIPLLLYMAATQSVLGELLLVQLRLNLPILSFLLESPVDVQVLLHVLEVAVHHLVLAHVAHNQIHAVVHVGHAHLLEPHRDKLCSVVGQVVGDEVQLCDYILLLLDSLEQLHDARCRDRVVVESHRLEGTFAIVAAQFVADALQAPVGDSVCGKVNFLDLAQSGQGLKSDE